MSGLARGKGARHLIHVTSSHSLEKMSKTIKKNVLSE